MRELARTVADGVVGKAVALLCGDSKIKAVYASTLGREAERLFDDCYVMLSVVSLLRAYLMFEGPGCVRSEE